MTLSPTALWNLSHLQLLHSWADDSLIRANKAAENHHLKSHKNIKIYRKKCVLFPLTPFLMNHKIMHRFLYAVCCPECHASVSHRSQICGTDRKRDCLTCISTLSRLRGRGGGGISPVLCLISVSSSYGKVTPSTYKTLACNEKLMMVIRLH